MTPKALLHGAKDAKKKFEIRISKFGFHSLRSWRLGAKNLVEVVLVNILSVRI